MAFLKKETMAVLKKHRVVQELVFVEIAALLFAAFFLFVAYCKPCLEAGLPNSYYKVTSIPDHPSLVFSVMTVLMSFLFFIPSPILRKNTAGQKFFCIAALLRVLEKIEAELRGAYVNAARGMATEADRQQFCVLAQEAAADLDALAPMLHVKGGGKYIVVVGSRPAGAGQLQGVSLEEALAQMQAKSA